MIEKYVKYVIQVFTYSCQRPIMNSRKGKRGLFYVTDVGSEI